MAFSAFINDRLNLLQLIWLEISAIHGQKRTIAPRRHVSRMTRLRDLTIATERISCAYARVVAATYPTFIHKSSASAPVILRAAITLRKIESSSIKQIQYLRILSCVFRGYDCQNCYGRNSYDCRFHDSAFPIFSVTRILQNAPYTRVIYFSSLRYILFNKFWKKGAIAQSGPGLYPQYFFSSWCSKRQHPWSRSIFY